MKYLLKSFKILQDFNKKRNKKTAYHKKLFVGKGKMVKFGGWENTKTLK